MARSPERLEVEQLVRHLGRGQVVQVFADHVGQLK